jgi:hypothetical protein
MENFEKDSISNQERFLGGSNEFPQEIISEFSVIFNQAWTGSFRGRG